MNERASKRTRLVVVLMAAIGAAAAVVARRIGVLDEAVVAVVGGIVGGLVVRLGPARAPSRHRSSRPDPVAVAFDGAEDWPTLDPATATADRRPLLAPTRPFEDSEALHLGASPDLMVARHLVADGSTPRRVPVAAAEAGDPSVTLHRTRTGEWLVGRADRASRCWLGPVPVGAAALPITTRASTLRIEDSEGTRELSLADRASTSPRGSLVVARATGMAPGMVWSTAHGVVTVLECPGMDDSVALRELVDGLGALALPGQALRYGTEAARLVVADTLGAMPGVFLMATLDDDVVTVAWDGDINFEPALRGWADGDGMGGSDLRVEQVPARRPLTVRLPAAATLVLATDERGDLAIEPRTSLV